MSWFALTGDDMGETAHNMHRRSAIQSLVFVTGLYAHYQRIMVVGWFCGREMGGEEMGRYCIVWGVIIDAAMWWFATIWSRWLRILRFCVWVGFLLHFSV